MPTPTTGSRRDTLKASTARLENRGVNLANCAFISEIQGTTPVLAANAPSSSEPLAVQRDLLTHRVHAGLWCWLIPRRLFTDCGVHLPKYGWYEDIFVLTMALQHADHVTHTDEPTYHYLINPTSLTNTQDIGKRFRLDMEFMLNMEELDAACHLSQRPELAAAFDFCINWTKTNALRDYYRQYRQLKPMLAHFPNSYKLRYCHGLKDVLYLLAGRYGLVFPFYIYNMLKRHK